MAIGITNITTATIISGGSTTLAFSGSVTAGSTLVAGGFNFNNSTTGSPAISDSINGTWTVKKYANGFVSTFNQNTELWLATFENTAGGTPTVTWNPNGTSADMGGWFICEVTGAATPTSVDVTPAMNATTGLTPSITSGTLAQAAEVLFAVMTGDTTNGTVTIVGDAAGGYTDLVNQGDNSSSQMGACQYKIVASTSSDTADWTITDVGGIGQGKGSILISIKEAAGGAAGDLSTLIGEPVTGSSQIEGGLR
ncbi:MAG: hypothetical protein V4529_16990 [Gemmatimonadota bacterium]